MSGKKYNRAVRFHKLMYEAFLRFAWRGFYTWLEEKDVTHLTQLHETVKLMEELHTDVSQEKFCNILDHMRNSNGSLSNFWMSLLRHGGYSSRIDTGLKRRELDDALGVH